MFSVNLFTVNLFTFLNQYPCVLVLLTLVLLATTRQIESSLTTDSYTTGP